MTPVNFEGVNFLLKAPPGMANCIDLPGVREEHVDGLTTITTCWELSPDELLEVIRSRKVLVQVAGKTYPPMRMTIMPAEANG